MTKRAHEQRNEQRILAIFAQLAQDTPRPETELRYTNTYQLLIAVVLSAQATDAGVNRVTPALFARVQTPQDLLKLEESTLLEMIRTLGLYRNKGKNLRLMAQQLIERHQSQVPATEAELIALAGVGRKTANVILNICFGQPTIAVDTHVLRVSRRLGLATGHTPDRVEQELLAVVPEPYLMTAHHLLILHGRHVCQARRPQCPQCALATLCPKKGIDSHITSDA